jgi:hypothetical protein
MTTPDDLLPGARTAVVQCLAITGADRVYIMTDDETLAIGEALRTATAEQGATCRLVRLEQFGQRPFLTLPESLVADVRAFAPTASFFAAQGQPGEIGFRIPLGPFLRSEIKTRHGHMIGITPELMRTGMRVDYDHVADLTMRVNALVERCRTIRVRNDERTDLTATFDPERLRWVPCHGLYHRQGDWGNLPEGETYTSPAGMEGTLTARLIGDYFTHKYGLLDAPAVFRVEESHVVSVDHPNQDLARELWDYLSSSPNGRRAGEFAIGTNDQLTELTGNLLQDEKFPGLHVAFGNPYPDRTGADWTSNTHVDVIPLGTSIWVDDRRIMERGRFTLPAG